MNQELKAFLESVSVSRTEQERLRERIAELESRCTKITASLTGMPSSGNADAQRQWAALADEKSRLVKQLQREMQKARRVEEFLLRLPVRLYRDVLMRRYVNLQTVPKITEALAHSGKKRSQRQVERIISNAEREAERLWNTKPTTHWMKGENNE